MCACRDRKPAQSAGLCAPMGIAIPIAPLHPPPAAAIRSGRSHRDGRDGPPPLLPLSPASGARRSDSGRDVFRQNSGASLRDPASSRQARRTHDRFAVPNRVSRRGAVVAATGSKSSLRGRSPGGNVGRRVRARRHRSDRRSGLCATTPAAIPIAPLHWPSRSGSLTAPCTCSDTALEQLRAGLMSQSAVVRDYRTLEVGRRRANRLVLTVTG